MTGLLVTTLATSPAPRSRSGRSQREPKHGVARLLVLEGAHELAPRRALVSPEPWHPEDALEASACLIAGSFMSSSNSRNPAAISATHLPCGHALLAPVCGLGVVTEEGAGVGAGFCPRVEVGVDEGTGVGVVGGTATNVSFADLEKAP